MQLWVRFQQKDCNWNWFAPFSGITHKSLLSLWCLVLTQYSLELLGREFQWGLSKSSWIIDMFVRDCLNYLSRNEKICSLWAIPFLYQCRHEAAHKWAFMQLLSFCSWLWTVTWRGSSSSHLDFSAMLGYDRIVSGINTFTGSCQGRLSCKQN